MSRSELTLTIYLNHWKLIWTRWLAVILVKMTCDCAKSNPTWKLLVQTRKWKWHS